MPGSVKVLPSGFSQSEDAIVIGELDYRVTRVDGPNFPRGEEIGSGIVGAYFGNLARARIGEFVALLLVGAPVFYALPRQANLAVHEMRQRPVANMGWGILTVLLAPLALLLSILLVVFLAIVLGLITLGNLAATALAIGGSSLALFWALAGLLFWMVSKALFAYLAGRALFERLSPNTLDGPLATLISLVVGLLLYELVRAIPVFGFLLAVIVVLIGIGAIAQVLLAERRSRAQTA